jgi:hypothetical protein
LEGGVGPMTFPKPQGKVGIASADTGRSVFALPPIA